MPPVEQQNPPDASPATRVEDLPSDDNDPDYEDLPEDATRGLPFPGKHLLANENQQQRSPRDHLPLWLRSTTQALFHDDLVTSSSEAQDDTIEECRRLLTGENTDFELNSHGIPRLRREAHVNFLHRTLGRLPAPYQAADASRPWFFYWALAGLSFMGEDVSQYRERLIETVRPLQNPSGGFGGGHGQLSHCACAYAVVLALACVGGLEVVDRRAMWHWLGQIKESDGGFRMAVDAEEDIRGAYCAMTVLTLLNLPTSLPPEAPARRAGLTSFLDNLGDWIGRCQTFEGGIAGAPSNEAHGAYAFCALACLSIIDAPSISIPKYLDVDSLVSCLASLQTRSEGGFAGRSEKLVDACYGHWVGGCWDLLQTALVPARATRAPSSSGQEGGSEDIWNRGALIRYLLCCAQQPNKWGGMRDKPSTRQDAYHTCYSLAGLSHAQNKYRYDAPDPTDADETGRLTAAFHWTAARATREELDEWKVDSGDVVEFVHPVFVLPMGTVEAARLQFGKGGFL